MSKNKAIDNLKKDLSNTWRDRFEYIKMIPSAFAETKWPAMLGKNLSHIVVNGVVAAALAIFFSPATATGFAFGSLVMVLGKCLAPALGQRIADYRENNNPRLRDVLRAENVGDKKRYIKQRALKYAERVAENISMVTLLSVGAAAYMLTLPFSATFSAIVGGIMVGYGALTNLMASSEKNELAETIDGFGYDATKAAPTRLKPVEIVRAAEPAQQKPVTTAPTADGDRIKPRTNTLT